MLFWFVSHRGTVPGFHHARRRLNDCMQQPERLSPRKRRGVEAGGSPWMRGYQPWMSCANRVTMGYLLHPSEIQWLTFCNIS